MSKILELIGFALIGGTIYAYLGMIGSELRWPVFWTCAGGALTIIVYRKWMKKKSSTDKS
jgi:hypothetical protein